MVGGGWGGERLRGNESGKSDIDEDEMLQAVRAFSLVRALAACTEQLLLFKSRSICSNHAVQITFQASLPPSRIFSCQVSLSSLPLRQTAVASISSFLVSCMRLQRVCFECDVTCTRLHAHACRHYDKVLKRAHHHTQEEAEQLNEHWECERSRVSVARVSRCP